MINGNAFTVSDTKIVVEMWQEGKSAVAIAAKLGNGRTRNSILGFVFRLRKRMPELKRYTTEKGAKIGKPQEQRVPRVPRPKPIPVVQINTFTPIIEQEPPPIGGVPYFETRKTQCKYILNTSKDAHKIKCCGAPVYREGSWCKTHHDEVFIARTVPERPAFRSPSGKIPAASVFQFRRT